MSGETTYDFEWDPAKALANIRKHGVSFEEAASVLLDLLALTVYDQAHSHLEERWFTLGLDMTGKLLVIAPTRSPVQPTSAFGSSRAAKRPARNAAPTKNHHR